MTPHLQRLRKLAEGATPGPWIRCGVRAKIRAEDCIMVGPDGFSIAALPIGRTDKEHAGAFRDAAYIAALSPEVVLAMLDAIEAGADLRIAARAEYEVHKAAEEAFDAAISRLSAMKE